MKGIKRFTVFDFKHDNSEGSNLFLQPNKTGYLNTLSGPTFLNRERWKKRYYVLAGSYLHRFKKLDDAMSNRQAEKRISLEHYDICQRDDSDTYKRDFVFIVDGAIGDVQQPRYVFAADSKEDMQDWMGHIRQALVKLHQNKVVKPKRPPRAKAASSSSTISDSKQSHDGSGSVGGATGNGEAHFRLYNPTKFRVRGPKGRRLPQKKNRLKDEGDKYRSNSLCEFEMSDSNDDNETYKITKEPMKDPKSDKLKASSSDNLAYRYSTSDDSIDSELDKTTESKEPEVVVVKSDVKESEKVTDIKLNIEIPQQLPSTSTTSPTGTNKTGPLIFVSAKLLEMSACLERMKKQLQEDLANCSVNLSILKKKLCEFPADYTLAETVLAQAKLAIVEVTSAENDMQSMNNLVTNIQKSLGLVQDRCENMLKDLSSG